MPELPEVEVTRRSFADRIQGSVVRSLHLGKPLRWPLGCAADSLVAQILIALAVPGLAGGCYARPALVAMPAQTAIVREETFAPILYAVSYRDLDEAIALHNAVPQGLSSCIFTNDLREAERFLSANPRFALSALRRFTPRALLSALPRAPCLLGHCAGTLGGALLFGELSAEAFKLIPQRRRGVLGFRRRHERSRLEPRLIAKAPVKPYRELAGDLEGGQRLGMIAGIGMGRLVSGDADLMEQIHRLRRHGPLGLEPAQEIGLRLIGRGEKSEAGGCLLREKFGELPQLDQGCVGVIPEITLGKRGQANELRVVSS